MDVERLEYRGVFFLSLVRHCIICFKRKTYILSAVPPHYMPEPILASSKAKCKGLASNVGTLENSTFLKINFDFFQYRRIEYRQSRSSLKLIRNN
jgi:hypothetical protein